jgi:hypothetical protein
VIRKQIGKPQRASMRGGSLLAVFILLAVVGAGLFGLNRHKEALEREAQVYADETAERLLFAHDPTYLAKNLSGAAALDFPPSRQDILIARLIEAREPARPITFEGDVKFDSYFFNPSAKLRARLLFAGGPGVLTLNISHPGDRWQIDTIAVSWNFSGVQ